MKSESEHEQHSNLNDNLNENQNEKEDSPEKIAKYIFNHPPQISNYYNLQLEEQTIEYAKSRDIGKFIQSILSYITIAGIKVLYGHDDWVTLNDKQQDEVKLYTKSYGYDFQIKIESVDEITDKYMIVFIKI